MKYRGFNCDAHIILKKGDPMAKSMRVGWGRHKCVFSLVFASEAER